MPIRGYLYVLIDTINVDNVSGLIKGQLSIGMAAKTYTENRKSGSQFNEVFLMEVPEDLTTKLDLVCING